MNNIRIGDTIISKQGKAYEVAEHDFDSIEATEINPPHRQRSFQFADLFCVDADDGLWQETEKR